MERILALPVLLALLFGYAATTVQPSLGSVAACPPTTLTRTGPHTAGIDQANTDGTWNLSGSVWDKTGGSTPVRSESWTRGCVIGGTVIGSIDRTSTRDQWYDGRGAGGGSEGLRVTLTDTAGNYLNVTDTYVSDVEDGFDPNSWRADSLITLDHVRADWIRDDCIENEGSSGSGQMPGSIVLHNSLLDGCFTAFAMRPDGLSSSQNGTGAASFTVTDSLIRVTTTPLGSGYCSSTKVAQGRCAVDGSSWLGSYGIWKWSSAAPGTVVVRDTVFRLDQASYSSCQSQKWPAGTYSNVTLVWAGSGPYASAGGCSNVLPAGVTLTTDLAVWENARAAWLSGTTPSASPTATATPTTTATATPTPTATKSPRPAPTCKAHSRIGEFWKHASCWP